MADETQPDQAVVRTELEAEQKRLSAKVQQLDVAEHELEYDEGFADSAQVSAELTENKALYDSLRKELDDIEHALARMDEGTYGTCEVCQKPIQAARLDVMPETSTCIDHAT